MNNETLKYIKMMQQERERALAQNEDAEDAADAGSAADASDAQDMQLDMQLYDEGQDEEGDLDPFENPVDALEVEEHPINTVIPAKEVMLLHDEVSSQDDYAKMPIGTIITTKIYDIYSPLLDAKSNAESFGVLQQAFCPGFVGDLAELTQTICEQSNFQICEVTRICNKAQHTMHEQFKQCYAIQQSVISYHGTDSADTIAQTGFRGAASKRAKFGRGIYSSKDVYHALAYSKLKDSDKLTFLVVDLHLGPVGLGKEDQVRSFLLIPSHSFSFLLIFLTFADHSSCRWTLAETWRGSRSSRSQT